MGNKSNAKRLPRGRRFSFGWLMDRWAQKYPRTMVCEGMAYSVSLCGHDFFWEFHDVPDECGNGILQLEPVTLSVWAYFRQLSQKEVYTSLEMQTPKEVLFQISYRPDITTQHVIRYKGVLYDITRVDVFEGYKGDLTLYCKRQGVEK